MKKNDMEFNEMDEEENTDRKDDDELLYNNDEDDKNEAWVTSHIRHGNVRSEQTSDGVLHCPCCFTPLCYDCQRHFSYKNQFRAMFVINCEVQKDQVLRFPMPPSSKNNNSKARGRKRGGGGGRGKKPHPDSSLSTHPLPNSSNDVQHGDGDGDGDERMQDDDDDDKDKSKDDEIYNPVKCTGCGTEVAVYDKDEVYHFFNVFASDY
eukprot:TRINITY_DN5236_c0_g1_i3.p1 TRINITY_DN5236_c0_g1~~TRINITY_DN5236_c0_g1_i3.p1  ORF type:complete len:207 (-),score=74.35 TRINITY_DN5236_c0_g1_i3:104-724(-)